ncbi:MAG: hypothetical protein AB1791_00350 [Chloroflexota bacterium]
MTGIIAAACHFPGRTQSVEGIFHAEGAAYGPQVAARLGIELVPVCAGETASALALAAAQKALAQAGLDAEAIDVIIDYSILPQEYLVPAWSMSNKLQHELNATNAFTMGFSGGDATNFLISLQCATSLIQSNEEINTVLLLAADVALPANRLLNPDYPLTVLGDGASAVVVQRNAGRYRILDTELLSDGRFQGVCYVPGGAIAHPDRPDLYRLQLNKLLYDQAPKAEALPPLIDKMLERAGLPWSAITYFLYPNISADDQASFEQTCGHRNWPGQANGLIRHGHVQGTDLVLNFLSALASDAWREGDVICLCSHGMGFMAGAALIQV